jgi:hypothetical protein
MTQYTPTDGMPIANTCKDGLLAGVPRLLTTK